MAKASFPISIVHRFTQHMAYELDRQKLTFSIMHPILNNFNIGSLLRGTVKHMRCKFIKSLQTRLWLNQTKISRDMGLSFFLAKLVSKLSLIVGFSMRILLQMIAVLIFHSWYYKLLDYFLQEYSH